MKTSKRILSVVLAAALLLALAVPAMADTESAGVAYVTISDGSGIVLALASVDLRDADEDGAVTINDALAIAHDAHCPGGYASATTEYGLSLTKLWNVENGTGYGYYLNDAAAMSLADPVANGDVVVAFVYSDTVGWSDTYSFFDQKMLGGAAGDELTLTLSTAGFDETFNPVTAPLAGAKITFNGNPTEFVTDENGKVTVTLPDADVLISATSDAVTLVPPVCAVTVMPAEPAAAEPTTGADSPATGEENGALWIVLALALTAAAGAAILRRRHA